MTCLHQKKNLLEEYIQSLFKVSTDRLAREVLDGLDRPSRKCLLLTFVVSYDRTPLWSKIATIGNH
jgi:hypothetical protein